MLPGWLVASAGVAMTRTRAGSPHGLHGLGQHGGVADHQQPGALAQLVVAEQHLGGDFRAYARHVAQRHRQGGNAGGVASCVIS